MDLDPLVVHVSYPPGWWLAVAILVCHTLISAVRRLSEWIERRPVGEGAVAEAVFPLFVGLGYTLFNSYVYGQGIRLAFGVGPAARAAGAAEAQGLLLAGSMAAAILAALLVGAHVFARRSEAAPMSKRFTPLAVFLVTFAALVTAELLFCASVQSGRPSSETKEALAALAASGCFAFSATLGIRAYRRGSQAPVHFAVIAVVFIVSSGTALTVWSFIESWRRIAMGGD